MMTHPTDDRLRAVAFGDLDITARLLVEAHLALCSECATTVALFGGAGDGLGEPEPIDLVVRPPEFDRIWARVEELAATAVLPQAAVLPASVLSVLPDPAGWRWIRAWPNWLARIRPCELATSARTRAVRVLALTSVPTQVTFPAKTGSFVPEIVNVTAWPETTPAMSCS